MTVIPKCRKEGSLMHDNVESDNPIRIRQNSVSVTRAAKMLGLSRSQMYRVLEKKRLGYWRDIHSGRLFIEMADIKTYSEGMTRVEASQAYPPPARMKAEQQVVLDDFSF